MLKNGIGGLDRELSGFDGLGDTVDRYGVGNHPLRKDVGVVVADDKLPELADENLPVPVQK
jgi:hypothetical protein